MKIYNDYKLVLLNSNGKKRCRNLYRLLIKALTYFNKKFDRVTTR